MHAACAAVAPCPNASRPAPLAPHRIPPFDSAVGVGVQPAAELRHLPRHEHEPHVRGALLPVTIMYYM
eukprot:scaffold1105_cov54-Phaeocystis_antarctica.AAC.6